MERPPADRPPDDAPSRRERIVERTGALRTYAVAGTVAALGVFTALAATHGGSGGDSPEPAAAPASVVSDAPAGTDGTWGGDGRGSGRDQEFFAPAPSGGLGPGSGSFGPPTLSGGS